MHWWTSSYYWKLLLAVAYYISYKIIINCEFKCWQIKHASVYLFLSKILILLASIACNVSENATLKPQIWLTSWRQAKYRSHKPPSQKSFHGGITNMDVSGSVGIYQIDKVLVKVLFQPWSYLNSDGRLEGVKRLNSSGFNQNDRMN